MMSSLSPANGSEEKVCKVNMWKVTVADLVFPLTKKNYHQIQHLGRAFEPNFGPGEPKFE